MRIRLEATFDVERKDKRPRGRDPEPYEVGLHTNAEHAHEHTGPSMGFRIPDQQDRQAGK